MPRFALITLLVSSMSCVWCDAALAEQKIDAKWIWFDEGNPAESAPAGKVWFRKEYKAEEPSTGMAIVACDDAFVLWVNGRKVGEGSGEKSFLFNLSGIVGRGTNVFAVEAVNRSGKAGLFVDAEIRGQGGQGIACDTGGNWKATREAPKGDAWLKPHFDDSQWKPVKVIGPHADSPWKAIAIALGDLDRFQLPPGFQIKRIADKDLVGSLVAMTWGNRGRLLVSREAGPIFNVIDTDGDGTYDQAFEYSAELKSCQGLCVVFDDLYAVGDGPKGAGLYRLPDRDHDDKADEVVLIAHPRGGMGEHGPHDVVFGPDGWLYHNLGNHAWIDDVPEPGASCRNWEEGNLLTPAYEDAGGHAVGIKAPGGTIWRFTPDGKKWWPETVGFRNQYDICFNQEGDLFTFDSDMEWDVNLPWYRPVRINHCIPGAEFGWRSGSKIWPDYYFDSLPTTIDIGRGSPTGVVIYEHSQFPEKYRGAMLNCDWSMGRIIVAYLQRDGATYRGTFDTLVTGNPLNVSDIEVDRDGSVVFCTGGRKTEGGIYRVTYTAGVDQTPKAPAAQTLDDALALPQPQAAWSREMVAEIKAKLGDRWASGLAEKVKSGTPSQKVRALTLLTQHGPKPEVQLLTAAATDPDPKVRQFAVLLLGDHATPEVAAVLAKLLDDKSPVVQRRACEAYVRSGLAPPFAATFRLLSAGDRWLRFAARLALEHGPIDKWSAELRSIGQSPAGISNPDAQLLLYRISGDPGVAQTVMAGVSQTLKQARPGSRQWLDALRLAELWLTRSHDADGARASIGSLLLSRFRDESVPKPNSMEDAIRTETARLLAYMQVPEAAAALIQAIDKSPTPQHKIHYAMCLRFLKSGWTLDLKRRYLDWYETTRDMEGGNSLQGYLRNIVTGTLEYYTPQERKQLILAWKERPHSTRLLLSASQPEQVQDFEQVVAKLMAELEQPAAGSHELLGLSIEALSKSASPASQAILRKLFDENADRRDMLARALAQHPIADNVPYLERAVASADKTTMQVCVAALGSADYKPAKPEEIRSAIQAGLKLGNEGGKAVVELLQKWTGSEHQKKDDIASALAHYQQWFRDKYPDEPPPELAREDVEKTKYTVGQLVEFLDKDAKASQGDTARGREVFAKANCLKCHRFLNEGEGVGPDLTAVRRRFQKKEILEAVLLPSQVISDQYAAMTVVTTDGLVHTGLPLPNPGSNKLLLLLSDATKIEISPEKIEEKQKAKVSVMPEGLFKDLSLEQIADLFAFLETSKNNPEPAAATAGAGSSK